MDANRKRQTWDDLRRRMHNKGANRRFSRFTLASFSAGAVAIVLSGLIVGNVLSKSTAKNEQNGAPVVSRDDFNILFTPLSNKQIPNWINHGTGVVASITVKNWAKETGQNEGVYIIPTSTVTSQTMSIYLYPNGATSTSEFKNLIVNSGSGPMRLDQAVNQYLKHRQLAPITIGGSSLIWIPSAYPNAHFDVVLTSPTAARLQASDLRLAIIDVRSDTNKFIVSWANIYSPTIVSKK